jgi:lipopolysaccharide export LptBFGC system permease protein LptF
MQFVRPLVLGAVTLSLLVAAVTKFVTPNIGVHSANRVCNP